MQSCPANTACTMKIKIEPEEELNIEESKGDLHIDASWSMDGTRRKVNRLFCRGCSKDFKSKIGYDLHLKVRHTEAGIPKCSQCDKTYSTIPNLKLHFARIHHNRGKNFYPCDICNKVYESNAGLMYHKRTHFDSEIKFCEMCQKSFRSDNGFVLHMKNTHTELEKAGCKDCGTTYKSDRHLRMHYIAKHRNGGQRFPCEVCGKVYACKQGLLAHTSSHHGNKVEYQSCEICGKSYKHIAYLRSHIKGKHSGVVTFACKYCNKTYPSESGRKKHEHYAHRAKRVSCTVCGNWFRSKDHLRAHARTHNPEYFCPLCDKIFSTGHCFRTHMQASHDNTSFYKCPKCARIFRAELHLINHDKKVHRTDKTKYQCDICKGIYKTRGSLAKHLKRICLKIVKAFKCPKCVRTFKNKENMIVHLKTYHGGEKYCSNCKIFLSPAKYKTHRELHKADFQCGLCPKGFSLKSSLVTHMETNHFGRRVKCKLCGLTLSCKKSLNRHLKEHGKKNLRCEVCQKRFSQKQTIRHHMQSHFKAYQCPGCRRSMRDRNGYDKHVKKCAFALKKLKVSQMRRISE